MMKKITKADSVPSAGTNADSSTKPKLKGQAKLLPNPMLAEVPDGEYVLCSAIWYKDLPTQNLLATNIEKGIIVCGHRHGHIIATVKALTELRTVKLGPDSIGETEQGFLTSKNRFVNREEAAIIAFSTGQITVEKRTLYSEDVW
jgi:hypothetical protein